MMITRLLEALQVRKDAFSRRSIPVKEDRLYDNRVTFMQVCRMSLYILLADAGMETATARLHDGNPRGGISV